MTSQPGRPHPRLRRWLFVSLVAYPAWLLLLGPFWALDGRGVMNFLPLGVRKVAYLPAIPLFRSEAVSPLYESYMDWWYKDPDAPETTR